MSDLQFRWDNRKEAINIKKHKIHFAEAASVFYDEYAREYYDPDHSEKEERFLMLGMSRNLRVLVISYCYRESDKIIRIISSRKALKKEIKTYFARGHL